MVMTFRNHFDRIFDGVLDVCAWIACGMLAFQVVSVSLSVILRYFFNISFGWVTSINEWSLVYVAFLGAGWLQREGGHTSDDSIVSTMPKWVGTGASWLGWIIGIVACGLLVWHGSRVTWANYVSDKYDFFKLRDVPVWPIYAVVPFGSLLWLIQLVRPASERDDSRASSDPTTKIEA
jgi:TRAP-type C4-dicarboxylate transport system permease small subunit